MNQFELTKDREFSHSVLNYLNAAYQGRFAQYNILSQFGHSLANPEELEHTRSAVEAVNTWLQKLWGGEALFSLSWEQVETEEGKRCFSMLNEAKGDLHSLASDFSRILSNREFHTTSIIDTQLLLGGLGRYAYSRDSYLRGFLELAKATENIDHQKHYKEAIKRSEQDTKIVHSLMKAFRQAVGQDVPFYKALYAEVVALPGLFRTQIHDMRQLLSVYEGDFDFSLAEVNDQNEANWKQLGVTPLEAGYWEAFSIPPAEALQWVNGGVTTPGVAGLWRSWGFVPQEAVAWIAENFEPLPAADWANAGYPPQEARNLVNRGVEHPSLIR